MRKPFGGRKEATNTEYDLSVGRPCGNIIIIKGVSYIIIIRPKYDNL